MAPNVILIHVDQWRGDCLSIDGHPVVQTPWLDQLAGEGVRFNHAYAACPSCIASRASLMTGLTPRSHGRVGYRDGVPWNYQTTMAGEFTRQGYQTQAIGKMHVYPVRSRVGFENVILHDGYTAMTRDHRYGALGFGDDYIPWLCNETGRMDADYFEHGIDCNAFIARPWPLEEYMHPTNWVANEAIQFLRRRDPQKPFFLYISFFHPHPPYDPPAWAFEQYLHEKMPPVPVGDWADLHAAFETERTDSAWKKLDPRVLQRARAGYYGHMTHIDHQINRFLDELKGFKLAQDSWVCFTSDHGELLGDHHLYGKRLPYEGSARVPLILKGPKGSDVPRGLVRDAVVEQRDIMPTLLECAGLKIPKNIEGHSFLDVALGKAKEIRPYLHGEHHVWAANNKYKAYSIQWLTDGRQKYIWLSGDGHEQLFDLVNDPNELHNLAQKPKMQRALETWRRRLIEELDGREEGFVKNKKLVTGCPSADVLSKLSSPSS